MKGKLIRNILIMLVPFIMVIMAGCSDYLLEEVVDPPLPQADLSKFWYSRTRSANETKVMLRHHALGFSYKAVSGKKCNIGDVMCQVLNLDYLEANQLYSSDNEIVMVDTSYVQRGIADYVHGTTWTSNVNADLHLYKADKTSQHFLIETINDSTLILNNSLGLRTRRSYVQLAALLGSEIFEGELEVESEQILSENFRYALRKLEANRNNVSVIDSFLNIFGTHIVTRVDIGGVCKLAVKTSKRMVSTFLEEQEYTGEVVNLFFKKMESVEQLSNQTSYKNLFRTAEVDLKVRGGDLTHFDRLVADPSFDNAQASYTNFEAWSRSLAQNADKGWDEGSELIDMAVTPIYEFIPDKDLAKRVRVRMEASAKDMHDLYGDRNFTNAVLSVGGASDMTMSMWNEHPNLHIFVPSPLKGKLDVLGNYGCGYLHTVTSDNMPSKVVAATYMEIIPELGDYPVTVTYPVYENRIMLTEGIACSGDLKLYTVKWLYDRYDVQEISQTSQSDNLQQVFYLYLDKGRLFVQKPEIGVEEWKPTTKLLDYEWPGSIDINGNVITGGSIYPVFKFLDKFYLRDNTTDLKLNNLPGWYFNTDMDLVSDYYKATLTDLQKKNSGLSSGTKRRMVRNDNYLYKIIPSEIVLYE